MIENAPVLVTGGSGFVGGHVALGLMAAGHGVRITVRNAAREAQARATLAAHGAAAALVIKTADLDRDEGWAEAMEGCAFVHHVASPFPVAQPKDEQELIRPAMQGTLRVLRAARDAGVKRVILTSSFAAIGFGRGARQTAYTEADWTDPNGPGLMPYLKSKTLAERAAWDFVAREGGGMELAVINPVGIFGPALNADLSTSVLLIREMLDGRMPGAPKLHMGVVDVRDIADLQLRAMTAPEAAGERFLAVAGNTMSLHEIAMLLHSRLGSMADKAPRREIPNWLIRLAALASPLAREAAPQLGIVAEASNAKAKRLLGWNPRSNEEAIIGTARSLLELGLVKGAERVGRADYSVGQGSDGL